MGGQRIVIQWVPQHVIRAYVIIWLMWKKRKEENVRERDRERDRKKDRQTERQRDRSPHLNKKLFSLQNAETSLMIGTKIAVEETLPISEEVFSHLFNDHATGIFVGTRGDRLQTGNGSFVVDVKDSL